MTFNPSATISSSAFAGEISWLWGDSRPATSAAVPPGFAGTFYSFDITQSLTSTPHLGLQSGAGLTSGVTHGGSRTAWTVTTGAIRTQVETYISSLYSAYQTGGPSGRGQDQVTHAVPEASSLWFTGLGFFLLANLVRRALNGPKS